VHSSAFKRSGGQTLIDANFCSGLIRATKVNPTSNGYQSNLGSKGGQCDENQVTRYELMVFEKNMVTIAIFPHMS
jgi:hypothetical protein